MINYFVFAPVAWRELCGGLSPGGECRIESLCLLLSLPFIVSVCTDNGASTKCGHIENVSPVLAEK